MKGEPSSTNSPHLKRSSTQKQEAAKHLTEAVREIFGQFSCRSERLARRPRDGRRPPHKARPSMMQKRPRIVGAFFLFTSSKRGCQPSVARETSLPRRDQLALEPAHCRFGLQGVTEFHSRLDRVRATPAFKDTKVIAGRTFLDARQEHFGLALRTDYLPDLGHDAHPCY